jgi:phage recombination protein Bet
MSAALTLHEPQHRGVLADMADRFAMHPAAFEATVRATCMPDGGKQQATREEFAAFLLVAKEYSLNPLTKEIYAFPRKGGGIVPIVSIDGWVSLVNSHKACDGFDFSYDHDDNGKLVSCTCSIYRKDRSRPVIVTEYLNECIRDTQPWRMQHRMLRHKAMIQAARYAFGFSGIYDEDEGAVIAEARDVSPRQDNGPPPAPALPPRAPTPAAIEHQPITESVVDAMPPAETAEVAGPGADNPVQASAAPEPATDLSTEPSPDERRDGYTSAEILSEMTESYETASTIEACDELDEFYQADMENLTRSDREAAQHAAETARKRVEAVAPAEPAPTAPVDPYAVPETFESAEAYGVWLERVVSATTSVELAPRLAAAWKGTSDHRKTQFPLSRTAAQALQSTVKAKLDEFAPKQASDPAPEAAPQAGSDENPLKSASVSAGPDLAKPAATAAEYVTQAEHVLATMDGIAAYQWWLNGSDLRDELNPPLEHDQRSGLKIKFVRSRNAAQDAAKQEG